MASTRITDEDLKHVRNSQKEGERQEETLHRLLHTAMQPTCTGGNGKIAPPEKHDGNQASKRPEWADELKKEIVREVKTAIESALAR